MATVQDKPLNELLSRSMVDIYIGPDNTHWNIHEKLLCHHSPFFRKIFYSKTNRTHSFGLPDEEDLTFKTFVGWLYSSSLPVPREESDLALQFDLYLMAEKFEIPTLIADILQVVREWYKYSDSYPGLRRVQYIYANTEDGSPMRHMLVSAVARLLTLEKGIPPHWDKALRKNGQLAVDIIRAIQDWRLDEDTVPDARDDPEEAEELVDVEAETEKLDAEAERVIDEGVADDEGEGEGAADAEDSEATVVDSPTADRRERERTPTQKSQDKASKNADRETGGAKKSGSRDVEGVKSDFSKFSLREVPVGVAGGEYGTLRA